VGRRRLFAAGTAIFTVASLLCALAPDPTFLNLARALQGVGGAVMFAVSLALIAQEFPGGRERGMAMGVYGATIGVAVAISPLVGGALTDGLGWESIFYVNVPIGVAAIAITYLKLRESRDPNATRTDWAGVATFSAALFLLVLALLRGNEEGWGSTPIVTLLAGSAVLLVTFLVIERRVPEPMLPLGLFKIPSFTGVQLAAFAISGSLFALSLYLSLYLQNYLGYSPFEAGLRYLPITMVVFVFSAIAGGLIGRVPARLLMSAGLGLTGIGLLLMSGIEAGSEWTTLLSGFVVAGVGTGLLNPVIADVAVSDEAAWLPGSTTPSVRSASPWVSPPGVRSSSAAARTRSASSQPEHPQLPASDRASLWRPLRRATSTRLSAAFPRSPGRWWGTRPVRGSLQV
jgi:EmrB/QacA subfamily drug resistance transporter